MTTSLLPSQLAVMVATSLGFWLSAALLIGGLDALGLFAGPGWIALYAVAAALGWPVALLVQMLARLQRGPILAGVAIGTAAALMADGLALHLVPGLCGSDPQAAASLLFWGAGAGMAVAAAMYRAG